jgi:hypothetical protein
VAGDLADEIARLKAPEGSYLLRTAARGSPGPIPSGALVIHPAALRNGLALFRDLPSRLALELVEAHTYLTGAAIPSTARGRASDHASCRVRGVQRCVSSVAVGVRRPHLDDGQQWRQSAETREEGKSVCA